MSSQRWGKARSWKSRHLYSFFLSFLSLIVSGIALTSQSWLESREGNPRFRKAGLWIFCFKDIYDANFRYPTRINGCRHIFDEDLWFLRSVYLPGKSSAALIKPNNLYHHKLGFFRIPADGSSNLHHRLHAVLLGLPHFLPIPNTLCSPSQMAHPNGYSARCFCLLDDCSCADICRSR
ncbi:hypothetical protein RvY_13975-2 [Ramazzottius varieornatus]|uniref:Uncharacterized protein n=1 Tax=Ramazzottius varieornatus TaxID=947166 RepID=A0A1D1VY99_RAMVA|nr:hypothetical protein RvY_13975-2 [Ramazzottius varieornatus]